MVIGAIKCDLCGHVEEMKKANDGGVKPGHGWLKISPIITFQGATHSERRGEAYIQKMQKIRKVVQHSHYCPKCVVGIMDETKKLEWGVIV